MQKSDSAVAHKRADESGFGRMLLEAGRIVDGAAMFGVVAYLYVRDDGNIIVPAAPQELW